MFLQWSNLQILFYLANIQTFPIPRGICQSHLNICERGDDETALVVGKAKETIWGLESRKHVPAVYAAIFLYKSLVENEGV